MATVYWDVETYSQISLTDRGAYIYAADPATGIFFFCYAIGLAVTRNALGAIEPAIGVS